METYFNKQKDELYNKAIELVENATQVRVESEDKDIEIEVTGLRPGEKLYEEILMAEEGMQETPNHLIHIGKPIDIDEDTFFDKLDQLKIEAYNETDDMRRLVKDIVPTYKYK